MTSKINAVTYKEEDILKIIKALEPTPYNIANPIIQFLMKGAIEISERLVEVPDPKPEVSQTVEAPLEPSEVVD